MSETTEKIVEALLLSSSRPLSEVEILKAFEDDRQIDIGDIKTALESLNQFYSDRSIELVKVANGFRLKARQEYSSWIAKLWETKPQKYSRAMMETLALIAYKQPITRGEIEEVRGVSVSSQIIRNLMDGIFTPQEPTKFFKQRVAEINEELNRSEGRSLPNPYNEAERIIDRIINKNYKINLSDESKSLTDIDVPQPSIFQQESRITTPPLNTSPVSPDIVNAQGQNVGSTLPANFASLPTAERAKIIEEFFRS